MASASVWHRKWPQPDSVQCTLAPPIASKVVFSPVTISTIRSEPRYIEALPSTIATMSQNAGMYAPPAAEGPNRAQAWGIEPDARTWFQKIFSTVRAPHEPALTVESLAIRHTGRPSTVAAPVITPSAGSPSDNAFAWAPSSTNDPSSTSRATRSRANSLPLAWLAWWYFSAPPAWIRLRSCSRASLSSVTCVLLSDATLTIVRLPHPHPLGHAFLNAARRRTTEGS